MLTPKASFLRPTGFDCFRKSNKIKPFYKIKALGWRISERLSWELLPKTLLYHFYSSFLVILVLYLLSLFTLLGACLHMATGSKSVYVCARVYKQKINFEFSATFTYPWLLCISTKAQDKGRNHNLNWGPGVSNHSCSPCPRLFHQPEREENVEISVPTWNLAHRLSS